MTFTEIVTEIMDRQNLTSSDATTRVGKLVNHHYKRVTAALNIAPVTRKVTVTQAATVGNASITFSNIEKVIRAIDATTTPDTVLDEISYDELKQNDPAASDTPTKWAVEAQGATSVTLRFDVAFLTTKTMTVEGWGIKATLSGSDVPAFPETFHDLLIERVMADELRKAEKPQLAKIAFDTAKDIMSDLRMHMALSAYKTVKQGRDDKVEMTSTTASQN